MKFSTSAGGPMCSYAPWFVRVCLPLHLFISASVGLTHRHSFLSVSDEALSLVQISCSPFTFVHPVPAFACPLSCMPFAGPSSVCRPFRRQNELPGFVRTTQWSPYEQRTSMSICKPRHNACPTNPMAVSVRAGEVLM